jgi:hypothetical protein
VALASFTSCIVTGTGDRTFKLASSTTSEYGRYVKSLGEPVTGRFQAARAARGTLQSPRAFAERAVDGRAPWGHRGVIFLSYVQPPPAD